MFEVLTPLKYVCKVLGLFPVIVLITLGLFLPPLHPRTVLVAQRPKSHRLCHTLESSLVCLKDPWKSIVKLP